MFLHYRSFSSLSESEILAIAIAAEEEDARIYLEYADGLRTDYPATSKIFEEMAREERSHCQRLLALFQQKFGDHIPYIRREHVIGFYRPKPYWFMRPLKLDKVRAQAALMEEKASKFYHAAAQKSQDADIRKLLGDLALEEMAHKNKAEDLEAEHVPEALKAEEALKSKHQFLLTYVQPGLAGLMDGSVSTLAPIFAAAFATGDTYKTFLVGLSASIGAGISMGFTEAAHDDGKLTGRGSPYKRGFANGIMTMLGGLGHTLPYLLSSFFWANLLAFIFVFIELWAIAFIQNKFMDIPFSRAALQVVLGGGLVFAVGILIGSA